MDTMYTRKFKRLFYIQHVGGMVRSPWAFIPNVCPCVDHFRRIPKIDDMTHSNVDVVQNLSYESSHVKIRLLNVDKVYWCGYHRERERMLKSRQHPQPVRMLYAIKKMERDEKKAPKHCSRQRDHASNVDPACPKKRWSRTRGFIFAEPFSVFD